MSGQTIEEAWEALPEGAKLNARALALAVLEAVLRAQREGAMNLAPLRAQIEALGR
jgi:hypothetical protein